MRPGYERVGIAKILQLLQELQLSYAAKCRTQYYKLQLSDQEPMLKKSPMLKKIPMLKKNVEKS